MRPGEVGPMKGISAGRLAGPWADVVQRRKRGDAGRVQVRAGDNCVIRRVEDLPEVACPYCNRPMRKHLWASPIRYDCACGWGFRVECVGSFSGRDARQCDPETLLPAWPKLADSKAMTDQDRICEHKAVPYTLPTQVEARLDKEIAARAAVLKAFRRKAMELSLARSMALVANYCREQAKKHGIK